MALYLQFDGVDDKFFTPSITFNEVILEVLVSPKASGDQYIFDARAGIANAYIFYRASTSAFLASASSPYLSIGGGHTYVDGVEKTNNNSLGIPTETRTTIRLLATAAGTDDVSLFTQNSSANFGKGNLYKATFKNAGVVVADYDMTTGNVNDISGNGRNATLTGGTWLDDGVGGTPVSPIHLNTGAITKILHNGVTVSKVMYNQSTITLV